MFLQLFWELLGFFSYLLELLTYSYGSYIFQHYIFQQHYIKLAKYFFVYMFIFARMTPVKHNVRAKRERLWDKRFF